MSRACRYYARQSRNVATVMKVRLENWEMLHFQTIGKKGRNDVVRVKQNCAGYAKCAGDAKVCGLRTVCG